VDDVFEARQLQVVRAGESAVWPDRLWSAAVPVRTVEAPRHVIVLAPLEQGRRLLSDDIVWLSALAQAAARRIDALRVSNERFERNRREESIQRLATEAELRALRSQLNPHFLFNALTTVGYLIQHAPAKALDTLFRLTSVLRGVLRRTTSEFSTLGEEVDLINAYLDIERTRFEERLQVEIHMGPQARECLIPTLLLQPLVENAVKHGVASRMAKGTVVVRADVQADAVRVAVEDSGPGFELADAERRPGIGLRSVRDRLRVHYGASASLGVRRDPDSGRTVVEIEFPARTLMAAPVAPRKSA
jgi:LytS/YehU family sensor histidine kinase